MLTGGDAASASDARFFDAPILNSPYAYPTRHWELDERRQPTQAIADKRRAAQFVNPISKPRKGKGSGKGAKQRDLDLGDQTGPRLGVRAFPHPAPVRAGDRPRPAPPVRPFHARRRPAAAPDARPCASKRYVRRREPVRCGSKGVSTPQASDAGRRARSRSLASIAPPPRRVSPPLPAHTFPTRRRRTTDGRRESRASLVEVLEVS